MSKEQCLKLIEETKREWLERILKQYGNDIHPERWDTWKVFNSLSSKVDLFFT